MKNIIQYQKKSLDKILSSIGIKPINFGAVDYEDASDREYEAQRDLDDELEREKNESDYFKFRGELEWN